MIKYILSPSEMAQFQSYISQKQAKQTAIDECVKVIQQNQLDIAGIDGAIRATIVTTAIANGALAPGAALDTLQVGHDLAKGELTWPEVPVPHREPRQHFKRKKKG